MFSVKFHLHCFEETLINFFGVWNLVPDEFKDQIFLDMASLFVFDLFKPSCNASTDRFFVIVLVFKEIVDLIFALFVFLFEILSHLSLLLHELVVNLDVERVLQE